MAGRRIDSFTGYATAQLPVRWTGSGSSASIQAGGGRNGNSSLRLTYNADGHAYVHQAFDNQATWIVGLAGSPNGILANLAIGANILEIHDVFGTIQVSFRTNGSNQIIAHRGDTFGTLLGTSTFTVSGGIYDYWEFLVTIHNSTGVVQLRKNGVMDATLNLTGQNTRTSANNTANTIALGDSVHGNVSGPTWDLSDLYILDGSGTAPNTFQGDLRIQPLVATGAGALTQWTPDTGSNYARVNEEPVDGDTSYVSDATPGDIDLYAFGSATPAGGTIPMVQICTYARKDDAGSRIIQPEIRQGSTNYAVGSQHSLGTSYQYYLDLLALDPTGAAWSLANVNGDQYGVQEIS